MRPHESRLVTCDELRERIVDSASQGGHAPVVAHLEECAACRAAAREYGALDRLVQPALPLSPPADFEARLRLRLSAGSRRLVSSAWLLAGAVAVLALAALLAPHFLRARPKKVWGEESRQREHGHRARQKPRARDQAPGSSRQAKAQPRLEVGRRREGKRGLDEPVESPVFAGRGAAGRALFEMSDHGSVAALRCRVDDELAQFVAGHEAALVGPHSGSPWGAGAAREY